MRYQSWCIRWVLAILVLFSASTVTSADWLHYESKVYGFSMILPEMTSLAEKRPAKGWGSLRAVYLQTEILVLIKPGGAAEEIEFRSISMQATGIMPGDWKVVDQGKNVRGFKWFKTLNAYRGASVVYGIYGLGQRGNYIFLLKTDPQHFEENKAEYTRWYESIRLH